MTSPRSRLTLLTAAAAVRAATVPPPPTTLLGGFLGAGKTTALTHLLSNREGLKIAVLVNDVASVNVDAMALRRTSVEVNDGDVEMVELENGCVCCGPGADNLAPAVASLAGRQQDPFDHIVVELSGVADPTNVESNLNFGGVDVDNKVALVDANAFPALYNSVEDLPDRLDLAGAADAEADPCGVDRRVIELLLAQIETADTVLVNKCDLATADELRTTLATCRALNPSAQVLQTTFGDAAVDDVLPAAAEAAAAASEAAAACTDPACADPSHEHSHAEHSHSHEHTHSHEHSHEHSHSDGCSDPACTDPSHSHTHSHDEEEKASVPNSAEALGFASFVYKARRPFIQARLVALVQRWPLPRKDVLTFDDLEMPGRDSAAAATVTSVAASGASSQAAAASGDARDPTFAKVLRSKGTCWLDTQHRLAATWSHAGRHFRLTPGGNWWVTLPDQVMRACLSADGTTADEAVPPPAAYLAEKAHFEGPPSLGDRRQEIVFIGVGLDEEAIRRALDECLATDEEMAMYDAIWATDELRLQQSMGPFRFAPGDRVECSMGGDDWMAGTVTQQYFREAMWPADRWMPYQVELDDGDLIFAPVDEDYAIRRIPAEL